MADVIETLEVRRDDLGVTRLVSEAVPELGAGQVLLRVDRFGLTTNNVTYGAAADLVGYWRFFPADGGWGRIPVWGFAEVVAGDVHGLPVGTRVFGYLPMSTHLVVEPGRVTAHGFTDAAPHRDGLPAVYNRYRLSGADPMHRDDTADVEAIFVPLFVTSFVLADFLAEDAAAEQVVLSSASSKTSAGTALCLARRTGERPRIVGLTSSSNVGFVDGLGCYDEVVAYGDVAALDRNRSAVFVDVAGDVRVRSAVGSHMGDALTASYTVGMTHREALAPGPGDAPSVGPEPEFFFAPTQIEKRMAQWGPAEYQRRLDDAWAGLLEVVGGWIDIVEVGGFAELETAYTRLLAGSVPPDQAFIVDIVGR